MALYEHVFLAQQDIAPQKVSALVETYTNVIETHGGKVVRIENWGLRSLAYRVRKNRKAYYVLLNIDAPSAAIAEVERQMRINEEILRYMTVRVEKHEKGPSAMLSRSDREDFAGKNRGGDQSYSSRHQREDSEEGVE
ncbi:30S ribosomal protein S6 [Bartonella ancashensis]|uniref:Small ribosomal subunit protein bS6 n=1 Tax=Bartonella ancashensis TaxID=1318743 RepID=A0A0M4M6V7_9HYPH|nr:30S ribosomal protein S6 [Bartonella ancashensis]ALE03979.1 SSU ribosomal protein S6p [Bartonella ancashensis]